MIKKLTLAVLVATVFATSASSAFAAKAPAKEPIYFKLATGEM
jgi:hypothetical protein